MRVWQNRGRLGGTRAPVLVRDYVLFDTLYVLGPRKQTTVVCVTA